MLLAPSAALANSGIGYFMVLLPVMIVALLPVIPLEAVVLARLLKLPFKRALYLAFIANLWSTLAGIVLGIVIDVTLMGLTGSSGAEFTRGAALVMLVPMFFITWGLEYRLLKKHVVALPATRVRRSVFAANLLSYAAMMACVLIFLPERSPTMLRAYLSEALLVTSALRTPVEEFWRLHKRFPADLKELGNPGITPPIDPKHSISLESNGRITSHIHRPEITELHGKRVQSWPVVQDDTLIWKCGSPDLDPRLLPLACRERAP